MEEESEIAARLERLDMKNMLRAGDGGRLVERLSHSMGTGGPRGLGDPNDKTLSDYELNVVIPQRAIEVTKSEICSHHMEEFNECVDKQFSGLLGKLTMGIGVAFYCSNTDLNNCYRVRDEYLNERSHLRNTGIKTVRIHHGRFVKRSESDGPSLDQDGNYRPRKPECWDQTYGGESPAWASYQYQPS